MSEFWKRTIFGALYVAAVVGSILWNAWAFAFLFGVIALWAVREFHVLVGSSRGMRGSAQVAALLLWAASVCPLLASDGLAKSWGVYAIIGVAYLLVIFATLIDELWRKAENPVANWGNLFVSQSMIALPFCAMACLLMLDKWLLLALFVLIWVNDTGAYCVGSLTAKREGGNHKMFPRVSPKKSWEGLFGGFAFAIGAAYILHHFGWFDGVLVNGDGLSVSDYWSQAFIILFALLACIFGTLGDLMESLLKRTVGVKDSGHFLPGHGGVLDRFDSMLLAAPVLTVFSWICYAVSFLL